MKMRTMAVALAISIAAAGCGDPLGEKLESSGKQPYSDAGLDLEGVGPDAAPETSAPDPADEAALAKWAFVAEANRLCAERGDAVTASMRGSLSDPRTALSQLDRILDWAETEAALLGGLTPPPGDEAVVAELLGGYNHLLAMARPIVEAGGFRDEAERTTFLTDFEAAGDTHVARLEAYGLSECG